MSNDKHDDTKGAKTGEKSAEKAPPKPLTRAELETRLTAIAEKGAAIARHAKRGLERLRDESDVDVREVERETTVAVSNIVHEMQRPGS